MALIICPECTSQISDHARTCPKCGHPAGESAETVRSTHSDGGAISSVRTVPKLPVVLGVAAIILGIMSPWFFGVFAFVSKDVAVTTTHVAVGLPAILAILGFCQLPAGIGILMHKQWARRLAQSAAMGIVVVVGLWFVYYMVFSVNEQAGMVGIGFVAAMLAIFINLGLNAKSIKALYAPQQSPK